MTRRDRSRITKAEWQALGGLRNSSLFRKADRRGIWQYYRLTDWHSYSAYAQPHRRAPE